MATRTVKAWRGVFRGHLRDVLVTSNQLVAYAAKHETDLLVPFSADELGKLHLVIDMMALKLAQVKAK